MIIPEKLCNFAKRLHPLVAKSATSSAANGTTIMDEGLDVDVKSNESEKE